MLKNIGFTGSGYKGSVFGIFGGDLWLMKRFYRGLINKGFRVADSVRAFRTVYRVLRSMWVLLGCIESFEVL